MQEYYINDELEWHKRWYYKNDTYGYYLYYFNSGGKDTFREFYPDGRLKLEGVLSKGKLHGVSRSFYPGGSIECVCNFKSNRSDSINTGFYKNGHIEVVNNYKDGKLNGLTKYYHENGKLWTEMVYDNDRIVTVNMNLDSSGNLMDKGSLKEGNGTVLVYSENGTLIAIEFYKKGKLRKTTRINKP
jgi:antitoxin component YwqK of YwqJK toxin-antitoxin module